jgi:ribosomal protein S18 acetylase RimI-like enzyme
MSTIQFRPARPEDADAVVPLMYESSRGLIDASFRFGADDAAPFLRHDFVRGKGIFGHANQIVGVEPGGAIVATITAYAGDRFRSLALQTTLSALTHFTALRFIAVLWRSIAMAPLFTPPRARSLFLANACVDPAHRSKGIFAALLAHVSAGARADAIELDVSFSNPRAQTLYERLGFRTTGEKPYRGARDLVGFRRMEKPLAA